MHWGVSLLEPRFVGLARLQLDDLGAVDGLAWPQASSGIIALATATLFYLIAILSQFEALARLSAARAAMILNLEPAVSILMARLVINETLSVVQWSGVVLVISVIILSLRFKPATA